MLTTIKGLPTGYNKDLQEDKEAVFDAERTLSVSMTAAHAVVSKLAVQAERGVLIRTTADTIALSPPLIINKSEIDTLFGTVGEVLDTVQ